MMERYDSRADTLTHIRRVNELLIDAATVLLYRAKQHDATKLKEPEKSVFDNMTPKLKGSTYGSEEYKQFLKEMNPALLHHYKHNRHHPEHFNLKQPEVDEHGIDQMNLIDLIEMLFDWKAATERHHDGDIVKSIEINRKRFGMDTQLTKIMLNTINDM